MAQINVAVDDRTIAELDRIAHAKRISRPELLRQTIQELIEAHDAGRAIFQNEAAPQLYAAVSSLVHQLRELVIELDRAQADNAKLYGKLFEPWNGGKEANRVAFERLASNLQKRDSVTFSPFYSAANQLLTAFRKAEPQIVEALEEHLNRISEKLDRSIQLAEQPRQIRALYLGDNRMLSLPLPWRVRSADTSGRNALRPRSSKPI